jgi:hypothetical protein
MNEMNKIQDAVPYSQNAPLAGSIQNGVIPDMAYGQKLFINNPN